MSFETKEQDSFAPVPMQRAIEPDAHGQAALLLIESLIHTLLERGKITKADGLLAIRAAAEVKGDATADTGESETRMKESLALLDAIRASFEAS